MPAVVHSGIGLAENIPSGLPSSGGGKGKFGLRGEVLSDDEVQLPKRSPNGLSAAMRPRYRTGPGCIGCCGSDVGVAKPLSGSPAGDERPAIMPSPRLAAVALP